MRAPDILRSSALRLALAFAVAMTVAILVIFGFVYLQITASNEARIRVILIDEAEKGANYSNAEIRSALDQRLTRDLRRLDYVALFDADGALVIGNIDKAPNVSVDGRAHYIDNFPRPGPKQRSEPAMFVARLRPDGSVLVLGRDLVEVYALRRTVLRALATAIGPMLLMALAIGAYFARRAGRRLTRIHDTIARIMGGDLKARLPLHRRPDEIDEVSRDVNLMLDEIVRLLVQIKSVSDNIAHDLRTPLAVMRAKLERGLAGAEDHQLRVATRQALGELDRAMMIITALLRISEVESASRSSGFKTIDLSAICAEVFEFYEPLGKARSIAMSLDAKSPAPTSGDGDLMREALSNLIDNAVKFTPEGGAVRIAVAIEQGRPVVRVSDSGTGVEPGERDKIFERFYRTVRNDRIPGSGLGLSIAAAIANLHGFELRVEDNCPGALFVMSGRASGIRKEP
jgi:signal transduction histidine kinase